MRADRQDVLLDFLLEAVADEGTTPFPADVLAGLRRVVRCEAVSYREWSAQDLLEFSLAADDPASILPVWDAYPQVRNDDPLAGGALHGSPLPHREWLGRALAISDFLSDREFRSAQDRFTILVSLYDLALSSQAQGDLTGAAERLQEGVSQSAEARDEPSVAYYLEALAAVAIRQDNLERAVRLLAAADALLQAKGSGWLHALVPRAAHDDDLLAALHSRMGDAAFEQAWTRGRSLGGSRAVEYVLQEAPPDPPGQRTHRDPAISPSARRH